MVIQPFDHLWFDAEWFDVDEDEDIVRARSRRHQRRRRYGFSDYGTVFLGNKYK